MSASIKESKQLEAKSLKFKIICSEISKILYIYRKFAYFLKITVRLLNHPELLYVYCIKPKILYINYSVGTLYSINPHRLGVVLRLDQTSSENQSWKGTI